MSQYRITTPVAGFVGKVGDYAFADGRYDGEVTDAALSYFRTAGYGVQDLAAARKADAAAARAAERAQAAADADAAKKAEEDAAAADADAAAKAKADADAAAGQHAAPDTSTGGKA